MKWEQLHPLSPAYVSGEKKLMKERPLASDDTASRRRSQKAGPVLVAGPGEAHRPSQSGHCAKWHHVHPAGVASGEGPLQPQVRGTAEPWP